MIEAQDATAFTIKPAAPGKPMTHLPCAVCKAPAVGVACCGFGAVSLAYCQPCLKHGAEPVWAFDWLIDDVGGGDPDAVRLPLSTWIDGLYYTSVEWLAERALQGLS